MDLSPLVLGNECEDNHSLTQLPIDDVLPLENDPQNGMLGILFVFLIFLQILMNVFIHSCFIHLI